MKVDTKTTGIKEFWADLPAIVKLIIIAVLIIAAYVVIKKVWKYFDDKRRSKIIDNSTKTGTGASGQPVSINLGTIASKIHDAFYNNDWFGMTEDEEGAIIALLNVPKSLIPDLSAIYYQLYSKNLKEEFQRFLGASDWKRVENLLS